MMVFIHPEALEEKLYPPPRKPWEPIPTRAPELLGFLIALYIISLSVVVLRLVCRWKVVRFLGWDDFWIAVAIILQTVVTILVCETTRHGEGRHIWDVSRQNVEHLLHLIYGTQTIYVPLLCAIKLSILTFYLRLSASPTFRTMVYMTIVFVVMMTTAITFASIFQCWPIYANWDVERIKAGRVKEVCVDRLALSYALGGLNIMTDFWIFSLPVKMLWGLRVKTMQKVLVISVFSMGLVACIGSIIRLNTLRDNAFSRDPTWTGFSLMIWTHVETNLGIMAASTPAIKPMIQHFFPTFFGRLSSSGTKSNGSVGETTAVGEKATHGRSFPHSHAFTTRSETLVNSRDRTVRRPSFYDTYLYDSYVLNTPGTDLHADSREQHHRRPSNHTLQSSNNVNQDDRAKSVPPTRHRRVTSIVMEHSANLPEFLIPDICPLSPIGTLGQVAERKRGEGDDGDQREEEASQILQTPPPVRLADSERPKDTRPASSHF